MDVKDLVPVLSWFWLKGQCRYCHQKISWQYPAVEIITAICFVWLYLAFGLSAQFFIAALTTCFLIPIFITDARNYSIPDSISVPGILIIFLTQLYVGASWFNLILAAAIGGGFFLFQYLISRGRWIGAGDIRLGALMGVALGFPGIIVALALAYIGGAIIALILIGFGKKQFASQVPFGTFLTVATFLTLVSGHKLINWYWGLLGL